MTEARPLGDPTYGGPGFALVERAEKAVARHEMLKGGETVVVAVSGGPDSICLLDVLARLRDRLDLTLAVAHLDHGLSPASADVAARVSREAAAAGFEVHLVRAPDLAGSNLHARARELRYGFLDLVAQREEAAAIATGHTLDDRVETTLARLVHGAGTSGLAGLPPKGDKRIRPLIEARRSDTRAYCEERGLWFYDDPANEDERFERVKIRKHLVAAIEEGWGDGAIRSIATSAGRLGEDSLALATLAARLYQDASVAAEEGVRIDLPTLLTIPRALRRRVLELAVGRVRDRSGGIDATLDALDRGPDALRERPRFSVASGIEIVVEERHVLVDKSRAS